VKCCSVRAAQRSHPQRPALAQLAGHFGLASSNRCRLSALPWGLITISRGAPCSGIRVPCRANRPGAQIRRHGRTTSGSRACRRPCGMWSSLPACPAASHCSKKGEQTLLFVLPSSSVIFQFGLTQQVANLACFLYLNDTSYKPVPLRKTKTEQNDGNL
jgi:hypothetical protein